MHTASFIHSNRGKLCAFRDIDPIKTTNIKLPYLRGQTVFKKRTNGQVYIKYPKQRIDLVIKYKKNQRNS